jgi:DNA polymerase V
MYVERRKIAPTISVCRYVSVFVRTNPFKPDEPQYRNQITIPLSIATADSRRLIKAALFGLEQIFRPGFLYKKVGIILSDLTEEIHQQNDFFTQINHLKSHQVMNTMDTLDRRFGSNTIAIAGTGVFSENNQHWRMHAKKKPQKQTIYYLLAGYPYRKST